MRQVPAVQDPHLSAFLQRLRVDWPAAAERAAAEAAGDREALPAGVLGRARLQELGAGRARAAGQDPGLDHCLGRAWSPRGREERARRPG